jgi:hypothetical protein
VPREKTRTREKEARTAFVIMPFTATQTRGQSDLIEFFATNLKRRIESEPTFRYQYTVRRSDDSFNITDRIIGDLYAADLVLCDLSGESPNPNVMYELGVRLAVTNKPVILFRETGGSSSRLFDIQGFYAFEYSTTKYRELEEHIIAKMRKFESGDEVYESPVLKILELDPSVVQRVKRDRAAGIIRMLALGVGGAHGALEWFIDDFLETRHGIVVGDDSTTGTILNNVAQFKDLDWSGLSIRTQQLPAIQTLLSEPVLNGLVSTRDEEIITEFVARYYAQYYAIDSVWDKPTFSDIIGFLGETLAFATGLDALVEFLNSDDAADADRFRHRAIQLFTSPLEMVVEAFRDRNEPPTVD